MTRFSSSSDGIIMTNVTNDEYVDSNFEWSFLELTERMQQLLKDDKGSYMKGHTHKRSYVGARRHSAGSDLTVTNMLDILPKQAPSAEQKTNHSKDILEVDKWSYDIFSLCYSSGGFPLQALSYEIFTLHGLLNTFQLTEEGFMKFIVQVEKHYRFNPYHNSCHAADVLQTVNCMITKTGFISLLNQLEIFCLLLTAIVHDIEHTGTNNGFHKNSGSELAKLYVVSVLENHHLRVGLRMLHEHDILKYLDTESYNDFQFMLVTMILATDMTNHFMLITNMKLMLSMSTRCKKRIRIKRVLQLLLHCADISNPAKPWELHKNWVSLLIEEFFLQGDTEREMKLPITPNCDRFTANIATLQIGFMQTFTKDTFLLVDQLIEQELVQAGLNYTKYMPWHDCMEENMAKWNGKWKFLKYEQISELLADSALPRMSVATPSKKGSYRFTEQSLCLCCVCRKKRLSADETTSYVIDVNAQH